MMEHVGRLLTQREVAKMISMSEAYLEQSRFRKTGIPYLKIGRAVRYRLADVMAFMEAASVGVVNAGGN